jgi:hypothetical protein
VGDDVDMSGVDVAVFFDEVRSNDRPKNFGGCDGVLFGEDEDCVFDGVCGDDDAVVGFGVAVDRSVHLTILIVDRKGFLRDVDVALEKTADGHLDHCLEAGLFIAVDLVDADIVLAVTGSSKLRRHFMIVFREINPGICGYRRFLAVE